MLDGSSCRGGFAAIWLYTFICWIWCCLIHCCPCWPSRDVKVMFYNLSGDFRSPFVLFKTKIIQNYCSQTKFFLQSAGRPAWEFIYLYLCATVLVLLQTCLSLGGGGSVEVACGVHLSCSCLLVCWSLTSLCHSNGHIETMPAREINPFTALTRIRSQFLRTQWSTSNHSEWTRLRIRPLSHRGCIFVV